MTPRLVPHNALRHLVPGLLSGAVGLVAWWSALLALFAARTPGAPLHPDTEALLWLSWTAGLVAAGQPLVEGRFARTALGGRLLAAWFAGLFAVLAAVLGTLAWFRLLSWASTSGRVEVVEGSLALRWRVAPFLVAGCAAAWGAWMVRAGRQLVDVARRRWKLAFLPPAPPLDGGFLAQTVLHGLGGLTAGLVAALAWYLCGLAMGDRFLAGAVGGWTLGAVLGGLLWAIPERHFVGWVRVRAGTRPGWRVPLDPEDPARSERFVGHFARGMDLHLPVTDGAAELHLSVMARPGGRWAARGLSQEPVEVRRPLERVDLSYDPALPAPLETPLRDGDLVRLGAAAEVELVVGTREGAP